jgi:hypothetical protein
VMVLPPLPHLAQIVRISGMGPRHRDNHDTSQVLEKFGAYLSKA